MNHLKILGTKKSLHILGLMSGTSADGLDLALCRISETGRRVQLKTVCAGCYKFPANLRKWILDAADESMINKDDLCKLDLSLSAFYVTAINKFIKKNNIAKIDLIASHGQTIYHRDNRAKRGKSKFSTTWQIGDGAYLSTGLGLPVVTDFRRDDIAAGGAGAPLTPFCHYHLLAQRGKNIAILNIGGITNLTYLHKSGNKDRVSASDCGPGNMLIDQLMQRLYHKKYDRNGWVALRGTVHKPLLSYLKKDTWYKKSYPQSLGREQFGIDFVDKIIKFGKNNTISNENIITTVSELTVAAVLKYLHTMTTPDELLICGGGVHNRYFRDRLQQELPQCSVNSTAVYGFDPDYVEAVCFALLGFMYVKGIPAGLKSVTGAGNETVLGKLSLP